MYIVKFYGESFALFYYKSFPHEIPYLNTIPDYNFYSGGPHGVYNFIGEILEENNSPEYKGFIKINNIPTSGGYENVLKVLGDSNGKAFGLVQEEAYNNDNMVRNELNYITPIYMERLYIAYKKSNGDQYQHQISSNTDIETLKFLATKRLDIGSPNSGTHIISRYIINQLNGQIAKYNTDRIGDDRLKYIKDISNNENKATFEEFEKNNTDVVLFMISGSPNRKITGLMTEPEDKEAYNLIGVEPDFTAELNNKYKINLHFTSFNSKHPEKELVTTIGTFAWLVTNNTTPPSDIREVLRILNMNKASFAQKLKLPFIKNPNSTANSSICHKNGIQSPLCEFDFLGYYNNKNEKTINSILRNFLLFIISLIPSTVVFFHIISLLVSVSKTDRYHDIIVDLINRNIPENSLPSIFHFAKLRYGQDGKELKDSEYRYLKYNTVRLLFELLNETTEKQFNRKIKKLKRGNIARLIAIVVTSTEDRVKWEESLSPIIRNVVGNFKTAFKRDFNRDFILAEHISKESEMSKLAYNSKTKILKLLREVLKYPEVIELSKNRYWEKETLSVNQNKIFTYPFLKEDQSAIVNRIVKGISKLYELKIRISEDYTDGLLSEKHYNFLYNKTIYVLERLQNCLTIRLSGLIETSNKFTIDSEILQKYYVSNYIERKDYYYLKDKLNDNMSWGGEY